MDKYENVDMVVCTDKFNEYYYRCRIRMKDGKEYHQENVNEFFIDNIGEKYRTNSVRNYAKSDTIVSFGGNGGYCEYIKDDKRLTCY